MRNKPSDLNDHLFAQIERLGDEDLLGDENFFKEITRAVTLAKVAEQVIANGNMMLKAYDTADGSFNKRELPAFFGIAMNTTGENNIPGRQKTLLQFKEKSVL
jgi:hypothetical protein